MYQKHKKKNRKRIRSFIIGILAVGFVVLSILGLVKDDWFLFVVGVFFLSIVITFALPISEPTDNVYLRTISSFKHKKR